MLKPTKISHESSNAIAIMQGRQTKSRAKPSLWSVDGSFLTYSYSLQILTSLRSIKSSSIKSWISLKVERKKVPNWDVEEATLATMQGVSSASSASLREPWSWVSRMTSWTPDIIISC